MNLRIAAQKFIYFVANAKEFIMLSGHPSFQYFVLSIWVFFHEHSRITGLHGKGESISLTPHYHFHPLHKHLDITQAIAAGSSPLHIASRRTRRTGNLWFSSASR